MKALNGAWTIVGEYLRTRDEAGNPLSISRQRIIFMPCRLDRSFLFIMQIYIRLLDYKLLERLVEMRCVVVSEKLLTELLRPTRVQPIL